MKKWLMMLMVFFMLSCNVQKHVQTGKAITTENKIDITEKTDKNTTRFIVITKYQEKKDTVTGEYPVESITEIKEVNNDKVTTETQSKTNKQIEEHITEDSKTSTDVKWYVVCFVAGIVVTLIIIGLIKLLILYLKRGV